MNKENMAVLTNIIGAVESGGQVYGKRNYAAYAGPYTNSNIEHTVTLGWAQNYGSEAYRLITMIYAKDPTAFEKLDANSEIKTMINGEHDWVRGRWNPTAAQKDILIRLIDSAAGHECQDELFAELIERYITDCERTYTKNIPAVMMYCEIRHLGGKGAADRIFKRCAGDYSLNSIMNSLKKDQTDSSSNNQVGDKKFWTRHQKCREFIERYAVSEDETAGKEQTMARTAESLLNVLRGWIGYSEKNGKFKSIIDIYNSHKPLARGYRVKYTDEWCDTTVSAAAIKAGMTDLIGTECGCEEHVKIFKKKGIWIEDGRITPKPGYIILYNWNQPSQPNDGYSDHIGVVESVSGNMITVIEGNRGEAVARRKIPVGWGYIRGYAAPKYDSASSSTNRASSTTGKSTRASAVKKVATSKYAAHRDDSLAGTYKTTANLYCREDAGASSKALCVIPKGTSVKNYGYYSVDPSTGRKWLLIQFTLNGTQYTGFSSIKYMEKV